MGRRKPAGVVSEFLKQQYGIKWKNISAKLRSGLLREVEHVPCNLCGHDDSERVGERDKFGLAVTTVMCRRCGLLYLNPRPTAETYREFYEEGGQRNSIYHRIVDFTTIEDLLKFYYGPQFAMDEAAREAMLQFMADRGVGPDCRPLNASRSAAAEASPPDEPAEDLGQNDDAEEDFQVRGRPGKINYYAMHLYEQVKDLVPRGGRVFEPGASWGKMLQPWRELHGCETTGVEPKKNAVRAAEALLGIKLLQGFADDPRIPENAFDLVLNIRTINHMLDPLGDLRHAWRWLTPGGILFVDIQDAIREARYDGFERAAVEIDQPFMFSQNTLAAMVQSAGFVIVRNDIQDLQQARHWDDRSPQPKQIRIVGRKSTEPVPVDWPDPMAERGALREAVVEFQRNETAGSKLKKARARQGG